MTQPVPRLDVALMDRDHERITQLLSRLEETADDGLAELFTIVAKEIAEHFAREEALMREWRLPILECHAPLHARLLAEIRQIGLIVAQGDNSLARELMGTLLPLRLSHHIETADTVTAEMFRAATCVAPP